MSTIDDLQRLHEAATKGEWKPRLYIENDIVAGSETVAGNYDYEDGGIVNVEDRDCIVALHNAWPAIHRVLVAARGLMEANNVSNWVFSSDGQLTDHGKLFEALRALDDKEQRT